MIWIINILISAVILGSLIVAKFYENKTGNSVWKMFKIEDFKHRLEKSSSEFILKVRAFEAKHIMLHLSEVWFVLKQFYQAVQKLTVERFERIGTGGTYNGNKAASFYLKTIKEHKDKTMSEVNEEDLRNE